jgi:putative zinc finger protein
MTCVDVRDRLTEHALGLLGPAEDREVERHLEWCAGCRKESAELIEGVETVAMALPQAEPRPALEERVVHRLAIAAGRGVPTRRRALRSLIAVALAAAVVAVGAISVAVAERKQVQTLEQRFAQQRQDLEKKFSDLGEVLRTTNSTGKLFEANVYPGLAGQEAGRGLVLSSPSGYSFVLVELVGPLAEKGGPYSVRLQDRRGEFIEAGHLAKSSSGNWILLAEFTQDLSRSPALDMSNSPSLLVLDGTDQPVMSGALAPFTGTSVNPSPGR